MSEQTTGATPTTPTPTAPQFKMKVTHPVHGRLEGTIDEIAEQIVRLNNSKRVQFDPIAWTLAVGAIAATIAFATGIATGAGGSVLTFLSGLAYLFGGAGWSTLLVGTTGFMVVVAYKVTKKTKRTKVPAILSRVLLGWLALLGAWIALFGAGWLPALLITALSFLTTLFLKTEQRQAKKSTLRKRLANRLLGDEVAPSQSTPTTPNAPTDS